MVLVEWENVPVRPQGIKRRQIFLKVIKRKDALIPLGRNAEPVLHQLSGWGRWTYEQPGLEYYWSIIDPAEERYHHQDFGLHVLCQYILVQ